MFNERVMDHVLNPRNAGPLPEATHTGCAGTPGEGRYIKIHLAIEEGQIKKASYECNGCPASIASASLVCQLVCGKLVRIIGEIEPSDVILVLGGLPEGKEDMAEMAVGALRSAVEQRED
jgi:NifU-like protein involved in Fe-S cluster formation